jgi:glycine cleavage system H lipoate-binding protein
MQAEVVRRRECATDYACTACRFDRALRRTARANRRVRLRGGAPSGRRGAIVSWKVRLRELPAWRRPCIHHLKQRIAFRACNQDYRCGSCDFDQYFSDQFSVHAAVRPVAVRDVGGVKLPQGYYLHRGHCWVKIEEGGEVRVGLDDFALRVLGPPDRIEAPLVGKELKTDAAGIALNRGALTARLLSPVGGVVTDVNPALRERGALASADPYAGGWVLRVHAGDLRTDLKRLMIGEQAADFLSGEIDRLYGMIEEKAGPLAADGGHLGQDIFGHLPQLGWGVLTAAFLRT